MYCKNNPHEYHTMSSSMMFCKRMIYFSSLSRKQNWPIFCFAPLLRLSRCRIQLYYFKRTKYKVYPIDKFFAHMDGKLKLRHFALNI